MGQLTEPEIFDCLVSNFRLAAEACDKLAVTPRPGKHYKSLIESLKLTEGACRQAAMWRQDARWLRIGLQIAHAHKLAGNWLRGAKTPEGHSIKLADIHRHERFTLLANNLRAGMKRAIEFRDNATGRIGMILPVPQAAPHRDTRPVHVSVPDSIRRSSGLIVPAGITVQ